MAFIRSISGLRATLGDDLSPVAVVKYALGFAKYCPAGSIIVGSDGRPSGSWIERAAISALTAAGRNVTTIGVAPTPTVQFAVEKSGAAGGIAITASHNPENWNGLKFLNSKGVFLDASENAEFWEIVDSENFDLSPDSIPADVEPYKDAVADHISSILNLDIFSKNGVAEYFDEREFVAVVDAVNASGSRPIPAALELLGCKVKKLHCDGSGIFPHTPEPIPDNLGELSEAVKKFKADIGVAVDPDADRLVLIDEFGEPIGEEKTIVLATKALLKLTKAAGGDVGPVVINHSTTKAVEDVAREFGAVCFRSSVGEINVVKKMKETGAIIGGEGSGGVILPASHFGRDSIAGVALILSLIAAENKPLSRLAVEVPEYFMIKTKKPFAGNFTDVADGFVKEFGRENLVGEDGVKFDFGDSWVQIRASNTEPIVRIIAEAKSRSESEELVEKASVLL